MADNLISEVWKLTIFFSETTFRSIITQSFAPALYFKVVSRVCFVRYVTQLQTTQSVLVKSFGFFLDASFFVFFIILLFHTFLHFSVKHFCSAVHLYCLVLGSPHYLIHYRFSAGLVYGQRCAGQIQLEPRWKLRSEFGPITEQHRRLYSVRNCL